MILNDVIIFIDKSFPFFIRLEMSFSCQRKKCMRERRNYLYINVPRRVHRIPELMSNYLKLNHLLSLHQVS